MRLAEIRAALRAIGRAPLIPALVVTLAATGLGFALAMAAMVDALYLRPLPWPSSDRLVTIFETHPERGRMAVTPANFLDWSPAVTAFSVVSGSQWIEVSLNGDAGSERLTGARVLPGFFEVWGLAPLRGRTPEASDGSAAAPVAVVGERVWRQRLGANPNAICSTVRIDGVAHTLIGVMPSASSAIGRVEVWVPWIMSSAERAERRFHLVSVIGRLRAGRSLTAAQAELAAQYKRLASDHPDTVRDWQGLAVPLHDDLVQASSAAVMSMAAVVALTFGVACLNAGALLAAWWSVRRPELMTRIALGASRRRIVGQLVAESVVIASAGVVGAVLVARACLGSFAVLAAGPAGVFDFNPRLDLRVAIAGAALFAAFLVFTALGPALRAVRSAARLVEEGHATARLGSRVSLAAQVAAALIVAVVAVALIDNVQALTQLTGTDGRQRQAIEIVLPESRYASEPSQRAFFERLLTALRARPELASVTATSYVPPSQALGNVRFTIEGQGAPSDARSASPAAVDPAAFHAMRIALIRGRLFDGRDGPGTPDVAIISTGLARRYWGDADPLGQRLHLVGFDRPVTIVGIVSDIRQPISADPRAESVVYFPFAQVPWPFMTLLAEPATEPSAAIAAVTQALARIDDGIAPGAARPLAEVQAEWLRAPRLHAAAVTVFGAASLLLTLAGVNAQVAYRVARRRREWALRQALGATPGRLRRVAAADVAKVATAGAAIGLALLPAASAIADGLVYGAHVLDWPRALLVALALTAAAVMAGDGPSRRAVRGDLAQVLRRD